LFADPRDIPRRIRNGVIFAVVSLLVIFALQLLMNPNVKFSNKADLSDKVREAVELRLETGVLFGNETESYTEKIDCEIVGETLIDAAPRCHVMVNKLKGDDGNDYVSYTLVNKLPILPFYYYEGTAVVEDGATFGYQGPPAGFFRRADFRVTGEEIEGGVTVDAFSIIRTVVLLCVGFIAPKKKKD